MRIAYTMSPGRGDTDLVLARLATGLADAGLRTCGVVQINTERPDTPVCDMDVKVLPEGPVIRISQTLGPGARGCRLDPPALEEAVGLVSARLAAGADVLIVNKFGKHEAGGRGFRDVIADALARDVPVVVGVNGMNERAFLDFTADMATRVDPDADALRAWLDAARLAA
ncbi:DUF2478 domain-containing protein [Stappia sp.]|uniref:DUF2478 domain-containing protein n=1 Tax=Stappia sp. TaxID=1870903 RepID=UPI0032D95154